MAAREAGGPDFGLAVDCHGRLNPKQGIRLCRELEGLDLLFVEEPVPPEGVEELCLVQRETAIPIAAGERWATIYGVRPFLDKHAVDILQCDIVNCGGITGMKKIAALAEAHYIGMAPHNPNGPVATMINLHYAAMIPNFFILETVGSEADERIAGEFLQNPVRMENGSYAPARRTRLRLRTQRPSPSGAPAARRRGYAVELGKGLVPTLRLTGFSP